MASIRSDGRAAGPVASPVESLAAGRCALVPIGTASIGRKPVDGSRAAGAVSSLAFGGCSDAGPVRPHNEDCWRALPEAGLFVVADGMGGYRAGEVAAELAVETACGLVPAELAGRDPANRDPMGQDPMGQDPMGQDPMGQDPSATLSRAFAACNQAIIQWTAENPDCLGMGTTLVACLVRDGVLHVAHVGDSRAYLLRAGELHRLTRDHSIGQALHDSGAVTEAQLRQLPGRGILTRALGVEESVACDQVAYAWEPGDRLLLCSDGVNDVLSDETVASLLAAADAAGPLAQAQALVAAAIQAGGCDNVTALVVHAADHHPHPPFGAGASDAVH